MIELGAVAYRDGKEISHFYGALKEIPELARDESTMEFWNKHLKRWKEIKAAEEDASAVIHRFFKWVSELPQPHTLTANPAPFDCAFLFWYLNEFMGCDAVNNLFKRHRAFDIRTAIAIIFNEPFSKAERMLLPNDFSEGLRVTHNALEDAREQGVSLVNLLKFADGE